MPGDFDVRELLARWGLRPDKGLGQNFLVDQTILERIVEAAALTDEDVVLEIGAGPGTLTSLLARRAGHVVAVELDQRFFPILQSVLKNFTNITLVQGDILTLDPAALALQASRGYASGYKVVANLPYYITSAVLRHLLEASPRPASIVVTVQREVAQRLIAAPGEMSLLSVSVQLYGEPRLLFRIKPGSFYPPPEVESAVVRIVPHATPPVQVADTEAFFRVVRAGFSQRRKQLHNALAAGLGLSPDDVALRLREAGVDPSRRAQSLSLQEWATVVSALQGGRSGATSLLGGDGKGAAALDE
ncbi:MAG: 16S rRNA (adenine(1518)-N(6)/adenine(1519)-N(6))-dimethyltransferase RsmA [Anaerolineae bacterium]|nr:16S rRNA (adenine(1518)-N(6)/adenine(1519)-N(6))-dimethyltransferase RsmA [Anaerolineae bacterium]